MSVSKNGTPPSFSSGFGVSAVSSPSRVPNPPHKITACLTNIGCASAEGPSFATNFDEFEACSVPVGRIQRRHQAKPVLGMDEKEDETTASGTRNFAGERPILESEIKELVDTLVRDLRSSRLLCFPRASQDGRHPVNVAFRKCPLHFLRLSLQLVKRI